MDRPNHERRLEFLTRHRDEGQNMVDTFNHKLELTVHDEQLSLFVMAAVQKFPLVQRVVEERKVA